MHIDYVYVQIHDKVTHMRADSSNMPGMPWLGSCNNNLLNAHIFVSIDLCVHGLRSQRLCCKILRRACRVLMAVAARKVKQEK